MPGGSVLAFDIKLIEVKKTPEGYDEKNEADILQYIEKNNLTAKKSKTGLYYVISEEGTGSEPSSFSNVTVDYKGYYLNGETFDEGSEISFNLDKVIKGWTEGITYFKEGGKGTLLIPAKLGYGYYDRNSLPGGSVLVFDINLISVN
ncbi:MAG: FKBP-type peptidyl-prolyl cis-trans isomerase [Ichthyobacteriaceae bacterium]|nr:FKBP-type peptidyl-prolyl cis-trans isomerase [Ichthyobacteriaceae bacterium]